MVEQIAPAFTLTVAFLFYTKSWFAKDKESEIRDLVMAIWLVAILILLAPA